MFVCFFSVVNRSGISIYKNKTMRRRKERLVPDKAYIQINNESFDKPYRVYPSLPVRNVLYNN